MAKPNFSVRIFKLPRLPRQGTFISDGDSNSDTWDMSQLERQVAFPVFVHQSLQQLARPDKDYLIVEVLKDSKAVGCFLANGVQAICQCAVMRGRRSMIDLVKAAIQSDAWRS